MGDDHFVFSGDSSVLKDLYLDVEPFDPIHYSVFWEALC